MDVCVCVFSLSYSFSIHRGLKRLANSGQPVSDIMSPFQCLLVVQHSSVCIILYNDSKQDTVCLGLFDSVLNIID